MLQKEIRSGVLRIRQMVIRILNFLLKLSHRILSFLLERHLSARSGRCPTGNDNLIIPWFLVFDKSVWKFSSFLTGHMWS